ncbi:hypothetical protein BDR03DRAFT_987792 [Suillus americanus]|nr:hypothetical protein BDR03DRAFT_987792 [Suillus americanus]
MSPVGFLDPEGISENILSDGEELLERKWTGSGFCSTKCNREGVHRMWELKPSSRKPTEIRSFKLREDRDKPRKHRKDATLEEQDRELEMTDRLSERNKGCSRSHNWRVGLTVLGPKEQKTMEMEDKAQSWSRSCMGHSREWMERFPMRGKSDPERKRTWSGIRYASEVGFRADNGSGSEIAFKVESGSGAEMGSGADAEGGNMMEESGCQP